MVTKAVELKENVVTLARKRIQNIFDNKLPVYLGMSGGKDSIVLADVVFKMIEEGRIDPSQLVVQFIDEEAMHEEVIRVTKDWRRKFLSVGAKFDWFAIEVKHFNCFNMLTNDESFICWDHKEKDKWVRPMPKFAIRDHPLLKPRIDTYQDFLIRATRDGVTITGVRNAESVQRLTNFRNTSSGERLYFKPIYDWKDVDVWKYIQDNKLDFPETYLHLYQVGLGKRDMRLSQFFSIDTAKVLVRLAEYDHALMERVIKREPNAYLAALYWDSELFGGKVNQRISNGDDVEEVDYKVESLRLLKSPDYSLQSTDHAKRELGKALRTLILSDGGHLTDRNWKEVYSIIQGGDPKRRKVRALYTAVASKRAVKKR